MTETTETLYERVGGEQGVIDLVDSFYQRVLIDDELGSFFDTASVDSLKNMQREFFTVALGGQGDFSDRRIAEAHQGRNIEVRHFDKFVKLLFETLAEFDLNEDERYQVISQVNTYVGDVVMGADSQGD